MQMEKETKKHFPPGQVITYINMLKKTLKIGMVCIFKETDHYNNDSGEEACSGRNREGFGSDR